MSSLQKKCISSNSPYITYRRNKLEDLLVTVNKNITSNILTLKV